MKLSLETLAHDFCQREVLPQARGIQYPKILAAMNEAASFVLERTNKELKETLDTVQRQRMRGDAAQ
jgi:hypothetical protein